MLNHPRHWYILSEPFSYQKFFKLLFKITSVLEPAVEFCHLTGKLLFVFVPQESVQIFSELVQVSLALVQGGLDSVSYPGVLGHHGKHAVAGASHPVGFGL